MDTITVNKDKLLAKLQENREKHKGEYQTARDAWRLKVTEALQDAAGAAERGIEYKTSFNLPKPESHTDDYDTVIGMLEYHVGETIEMSTYEFRQYVNDVWDWSGRFKASTAQYTAS